MARTRKVHHTAQDHVGVLRRIEHLGMSRGRSGSKTWLYVGTGLWTLRTVRRLADRREEILISEPLRPGDRLIISNDRPTLGDASATLPRGRRAKKKYRKAQAQAAKEQAKRDKKAEKADAKMQAKIARKQAKKPKKVDPTETVVAD
ncbi:MAG: hypothetical protein ACTHN0_16220 [Aquihabitans sp.]